MLKIDIEMYRNVVGNKLGSAGLLTFLGNLGGAATLFDWGNRSTRKSYQSYHVIRK